MAAYEESCQSLDEELAACDYSAEEIKCMDLSEKRDLVQAFHLSVTPSTSPSLEKVATPRRAPVLDMDGIQQRRKYSGVSLSNRVVGDDQDEVTVLKEVASPRHSLLRRPPIHSVPDENRQIEPDKNREIVNISSARKMELNSGADVRARKKDMLEPANKQTATPVLSVADEHEMVSVNEYVKCKAEIYALNPFSCVNTALSTLAENSSNPKRKIMSVPFFYSEHALSLKLEDYVELCCRKFGCPKPPPTCVDVVETFDDVKEVPKNIQTTCALDEQLDFSSFDKSTSNYNLRQRSGNKRSANNFEFTNDSDDSDSIIPNKKNRDEEDATFSPREEAKAPTQKTRVSKLSLATAKMAAQQAFKTDNELVTVDSDGSSDSDVPGKEVCVPKLQYSAVVGNDTAKWKTSKTKVSAKPKDLTDSLEAMAKTKQTRAKPMEVIKPGPVGGKTRRAALAEESNTRKPGRGKQTYKKESEKDDNEENPEEEADTVACPVCNVDFPQEKIQTHVNACCDESASQSTEGQCPLCNKHFPQHELQRHSSLCTVMNED